jgi:hypothetical protein
MELNNLKDNVVQIKDYLSLEECIEWLQNVPAPFLMDNEHLSWKYRRKNLITHPIVNQVERFWNDYFKTTHLKIKDAELQLWPIKSYSVRHNHAHTFTSLNRTSYTYNSMLYLNDNYIGGEFFTDKIEIKPTPGLLTFFDGANTYHGVKPIYWNNRYSIIFWFG